MRGSRGSLVRAGFSCFAKAINCFDKPQTFRFSLRNGDKKTCHRKSHFFDECACIVMNHCLQHVKGHWQRQTFHLSPYLFVSSHCGISLWNWQRSRNPFCAITLKFLTSWLPLRFTLGFLSSIHFSNFNLICWSLNGRSWREKTALRLCSHTAGPNHALLRRGDAYQIQTVWIKIIHFTSTYQDVSVHIRPYLGGFLILQCERSKRWV